MEACTTTAPEMTETPAIGTAAPAARFADSALMRAAVVGLAFSLAFSSSFVLGFYLLGPWIDTARSLM